MKSSFLKVVMSKVPIFVILGSTGTGKSKLGIEIAKKFNGEIISADSMQVYKGLDVITNKVTPEEAEGIPHHLLDFLDPNTRFTVVDYRNRALKHIDDILQRNKVPIIVGGTNYYIESLLWTILLDNKTNINEQGEFTLYDMDKIRNLEHGRDVLESLWKLDKEEKDDLFKVHNTDKIDELEGENDKRDNKREDLFKVHNAGKIDELEGGNDKRDNENLFKMESNDKIDEQGAVKDHQTKMEIPATDAGDKMDGKGVKDQTERSATEMFRDKRKHKDNLDVEESAKRIKTDGDESKAQTELESSQDGLKGSGKLISKETRSQKVVETENSGNTTQKCDRQLEQLENSKQNADQLTTESKCQQTTHASHDLKDQPNSGKSTSSKSANIIESTSSNREGIKALVNVLDTLRGKMITDIEQANRFSLGYRTLKDIMAPTKEENAYEKTDFQCTNVKKMFENLNEKFEQFKEVNGQNVGDTESLRTDEYVSKEIVDNKADQNEDPFLQTTTTLFSDYRSSCTKLLEQFKHQTLLPKQFLYCVSIHQKSKPFGEKLALFGLSGSQLSAHVQSLARTVKELQERLVQFGVAEDGLTNTQSRTGESVTSTEEQLLEGPEAGVQLATLLTQFEQGIGCLNSRIGQKLSESTIDNVAEKDAVTSLLQSATSLIHHLSAQLIPPRPLVTQTKYFLPTDTDRTNLSHANLHSMLQEVDHSTSLNLHPKNRRKVVRALQVFYEHGRSIHDILTEQKSLEGGSLLGGPLRFPNTVILWLQCDKEVLDKRLEGRVHTMIQNGLIEELLQFHREYNEDRVRKQLEPDYTKGIFQSIGFKEFHNYLMLSDSDRESDKGREIFNKSLDALVLANVQYAKKQNQWVRNRLLKCPDRMVPPVYSLNCTDLTTWAQCVTAPALHIVESYLDNRAPTGIEPLAQEYVDPSYYNAGTFNCDVCNRVFIGQHQYEQHMNSVKHRRMKVKMERQLQHILRNQDPRDTKDIGNTLRDQATT